MNKNNPTELKFIMSELKIIQDVNELFVFNELLDFYQTVYKSNVILRVKLKQTTQNPDKRSPCFQDELIIIKVFVTF